MRTIANRPLIFLETKEAEQLAVRLRLSIAEATRAVAQWGEDTQTLSEFVGGDKLIRYGIITLGPEVPDGMAAIPVSAVSDDHTISPSELRHVSKEVAASYPHARLNGHEVIITIKGTLGKTAVIPTSLSGLYITREIAVIPTTNQTDADYVLAALNSKLGMSQITINTFGESVAESIVGSGIPLSDLRKVRIPRLQENAKSLLLNRSVQICGAFSDLGSTAEKVRDDLQTNTSLQIDTLFAAELGIEKFRPPKPTKFFLRAYRKAERLDLPANHPNYTKLVDQINESANSGYLSEVVDVSEERFSPDDHMGEEINYLAIGDIDGISGKIIEPQKMTAEELPSRARRIIREGDILVGIAGASTGTENMVVFPVAQEQEGWVATTGFLILRPRDGVDIRYVCTLLKAPFVLKQIRALLTSPAMPTISENDFLHLSVPVTDSEARERTLSEISKILLEEQRLAIHLDDISRQIQQLLSETKSNIFDLLDDDKFSGMSVKAKVIEEAMAKIEEALQ